MRISVYLQVFIALVVLLPLTEDLCKALFLSSFATSWGINVALWATRNVLESYEALSIIGTNILLVAPIILSIMSLLYKTSKMQIGFTICLAIFQLIYISSFIVTLPIAISYNSQSIAAFRKVCKDYYIAFIILTVSSLVQFAFLCITTVLVFRRSLDLSQRLRSGFGFAPTQSIKMAGVIPYIFAIMSLVLLERLRTFANITSDAADQGLNDFGYGQIFALATVIAPLIEVIKYIFRKTDRLSGHSPFSYVIQGMNFHKRTYSSRSRLPRFATHPVKSQPVAIVVLADFYHIFRNFTDLIHCVLPGYDNCRLRKCVCGPVR